MNTITPTSLGKSISLISTFTPDRSNYIALPNPQVFNPAEAISLYPSLKYFIFKASWSLVDEGTKESKTHQCYLSWAGQYTQSTTNLVSIPSHLGDALKIPRGTLVNLQLIIPPAPASFISLTPLTTQDYSIADVNKEYLTDNLLSLVSLINLELPLKLWVRGSLVTFKASLTPEAKRAPKSQNDDNGKDNEVAQPQYPIALLAPNTMVEIVTVKATAGKGNDEKMGAALVDPKNPSVLQSLKKKSISPSFPNLLVTIVPLPSSVSRVDSHKELQAAAKASGKKKVLDGPQAIAPSPLSAHLNTGILTNAHEEPETCDGTIYVSAELYTMLGFDVKGAQQGTKPTNKKNIISTPSNAILPIAILRTDRRAKPNPIKTAPSRIQVDKVVNNEVQRDENHDPLVDFHMPFPTPIEPFFNSVISVSKVQVHPSLKGFVVALHSLQRHSLLLPSHSKLFISPFHPYLAQVMTNTSMLPFIRPSFRLGFSIREPQLEENDYMEDTSILRLTHVPPSSRQEKEAKTDKRDAVGSVVLSMERQYVTSMDYKSLARPPLRLRHIQFCLKSHIDQMEPLQLPKHWIELSFFMYLSNLFEKNAAKLIKKGGDNKDNGNIDEDNIYFNRKSIFNDYLVFGPSTVLSIPLYVSNASDETIPGVASTKDCSIFSYQKLSPYCLRQIPCLPKNKPKGGYRGHYPHYMTHRNQHLIDAVSSDVSDAEEEEEDEKDDSDSEDEGDDKKKDKKPKTPYPVDTLFWYTGVTISILATPQQHDQNRMASFVTLKINQIEHQTLEQKSTEDEKEQRALVASLVHNTPSENTTNDDKKKDDVKKPSETTYPIVSVFVNCTNVSQHPTLSTETRPMLTPLSSIDIITAEAEHRERGDAEGEDKKKNKLDFIEVNAVDTLPSHFRVTKFNANKYLYQEEESDEEDLMNDDYTADNKLKQRREQAKLRKEKKIKMEEREAKRTERLLRIENGEEVSDLEEDEDDLDEDSDEDYEDEEDEDEDEESPMNKLLGKFNPQANAPQESSRSNPKSLNTVGTKRETAKHNHKNITDDDLEWDEEDHKEEMAYFQHFVKFYKNREKKNKESQEDGQNDGFNGFYSDDDESESDDFDPDNYEYDEYEECYYDVYGNRVEADEYEKMANGTKTAPKDVFTYTQRYRFTTPTQVIVHDAIFLPQLTSDTWQTFCPPSPGDDSAENGRAVGKNVPGTEKDGKKAGADPKNIQTAAAKMMQGQQPGGEEEEEEPPDPAVLDFMAQHSKMLLQRPYMLNNQQLDLIYEHIESTVNHLNASLSLAFPFNQQVFYPVIQNPQVLHIPNSPLSGKPYVEALPKTTLTNGDSSEPNPICIASPISPYMYKYLSSYPYSTTMLSWFDSLCTSLALLQPYFNHLNTLSPFVAMQLPESLDQNTQKHLITTRNASNPAFPMNAMIVPQQANATAAKVSLIGMKEIENKDKIDIMRTHLPTLSGSITNAMTHGILYGSNKSGKTTSICYLAHILSQHPSINAHVAYLDCTPYEEASVQIITILFQHIFATARLKHSPTVLLLDNLDIIAHPEKDHEDNSVMEAVVELLINHHHQQLQDRTAYPTIFLATAKHADALHPRIVSQLFSTYSCTIEPPTYNQRQFVLLEQLNSFATTFSSRTTKQSINDRKERQLDIDVLQTTINNTEGYTFPDITLLVHKIVNFMTLQQQKKIEAHIKMLRQQRGTKGTSTALITTDKDSKDTDDKKEGSEAPKTRWGLRDITSELVTKLTSAYVPLTLRGIGLSKPPNATDQKKWYDVGALDKVIQTLRQTFEYPVLYPQLFNNSPLKLISGALVYGAPGSGKSILATALQFSCPKLHFIRVKGPEVLDKYVGASEDNVRKIFASARAAKPCVIFFDDFDSIALKRGSDSNGVTDRVVNQLLVEMDGVKGREGVFVLAATTHPELIDSALLRPGRLDLQLYCPLPEGIKDRESVLRSIGGCNRDYKPKELDDEKKEDVTTTASIDEKKEEVAVEKKEEVTTTTSPTNDVAEKKDEFAEEEKKAEVVEEDKKDEVVEEDKKDQLVEDKKDEVAEAKNDETISETTVDGEVDSSKAPEATETTETTEATVEKPAAVDKKAKKIKKEHKTVQPPVQGAADYVYNTVSSVRKQYQAAIDQHNLVHGTNLDLESPQGRALAIKKYRHRFPYVFEDKVDFAKVARLCTNFTGADINALLTNAMLYTQMDDEDDEEEDEKKEKEEKTPPQPKCEFLFHLPILTTQLLIQGYNMTPISLPEADRKKFTEAFKKFIQDKDQPEAMQKFDPNAKGKVAMAQ